MEYIVSGSTAIRKIRFAQNTKDQEWTNPEWHNLSLQGFYPFEIEFTAEPHTLDQIKENIALILSSKGLNKEINFHEVHERKKGRNRYSVSAITENMKRLKNILDSLHQILTPTRLIEKKDLEAVKNRISDLEELKR